MRLRRVFVIFAAALFLVGTAFSGMALADDDSVNVSGVHAAPSMLSGDGQVTVTVNVAVDANRAEGGIDNVYIDGPGVKDSSRIDSISIGDSKDLQCQLSVTASQLGVDIPLKAKWDGGESSFTVKINASAATDPQITFTRTVDKTAVATGDSVTLIYNIENSGAIDISSISVTDDGIATLELKKDGLKAGSTTALTYTYVVNADFTTVPRLTFKAGGKTYTMSAPAKTVSLKNVQVEAVLEASPEAVKAGEEVTLLCTLTNSGNVKLTNLVISEATLGNKLFTAASLDKNGSKQFSKRITLTKTAKFQYVITAKDDAGRTVTFKSNELEVTVSSEGAQYDLEIAGTPDAVQLSKPGEVNFSFTVRNNGADAVANASVLDQDGKVIKSFASLAPGKTEFTYPTTIDKTTQFNFSLLVPGQDGNYQVYTGPMEVKVAEAEVSPTEAATASPEATATVAPTQSASASASAGKIGALLTALVVVGVLIGITIIVLLAMVAADKRRRKKKR